MNKYKYTSPTACNFSHEGVMYSLHLDGEYDLPEIEFVNTLVGQGRLVKVEPLIKPKKENEK